MNIRLELYMNLFMDNHLIGQTEAEHLPTLPSVSFDFSILITIDVDGKSPLARQPLRQ